jgi:hypothetical protein
LLFRGLSSENGIPCKKLNLKLAVKITFASRKFFYNFSGYKNEKKNSKRTFFRKLESDGVIQDGGY